MRVLDPYRGAFNPLTSIPWLHAWWAEGPEFVAKAIADTGAVGASGAEWPDEIGTADMVQATAGNRPTYRATGNLNSRPAIRFDGVNDTIAAGAGSWSAISVPFTVVLVAKLNAQVDGTTYVLIAGLPTATGRAEIMTNITPNPDQWMAYGGNNISGGDADTTQHLFVAHFAASSGSSLELDGTSIASGVTSNQQPTGLLVGAYSNATLFPSNEDVAFLAIIGRALTTDEKASLRTWSAAKYGTA